MLASLVLPLQILDYFLISGVEQTSQEILISLDEKMNPMVNNNTFGSKVYGSCKSCVSIPRTINSLRIRTTSSLDRLALTGKSSFQHSHRPRHHQPRKQCSKNLGAFSKKRMGELIPGDLPMQRGILPYRWSYIPEKQYKRKVLSGYRRWISYLMPMNGCCFPENIGPHLAMISEPHSQR